VHRLEGTVTPMGDNLAVATLVRGASNGENQAWDALIERYAPLIWSICRRYRLGGADAEDVAQAVWLKLVDHLDHLRNPAALPGWLATTARRECGRVLRVTGTPRAWERVVAAENIPDTQTATAEEELLTAERHAALHEAFLRLPPNCQRLLALLIEDPPLPYAEIGARLGIPAGSIGPNRGRCLERLRRDPVIAALINAEAASAA
jgi:RNA polymerase sigma factor (sigma-70 family)